MVTIAWDVDDVLNDLMREWFETGWKTEHRECKVTYEDLSENPPHRILGVTKEIYLESLDTFRAGSFHNRMIPVLPVKEWFVSRGHEFRHIALTSVPFFAASDSARWVLTHFGKWIRTFHFVPSPRATYEIPTYDRTKQEFLEWIQRVDCLVDDNEDNIEEAKSVGVQGLLFPRPWNSEKNKPVESVLTSLSSLQLHEKAYETF
jgi:hypothetical protein